MVEGQHWTHPAVNPDVPSQLLEREREREGDRLPIRIHSHHSLYKPTCPIMLLQSSPPLRCEVLSSFASLPCTSASRPPESALELPREPADLEEGRGGKSVNTIRSLFKNGKHFHTIIMGEIKGAMCIILTSMNHYHVHF